MSTFWKLAAMCATAAAAVVVANEVITRNEKGEDCSPAAVLKGIGNKVCKRLGLKCSVFEEDDKFFDDFDEFDFDEDYDDDYDEDEDFDVEGDSYVIEFSTETASTVEPDKAADQEEKSDSKATFKLDPSSVKSSKSDEPDDKSQQEAQDDKADESDAEEAKSSDK